MPDLDRLDRDLVEAGERWRGSQPPSPALARVAHFTHEGWSTTSAWLLVAAALGLVIVGSSLSTAGGNPPARIGSHVGIAWNEAELQAAAVHPGDTVAAAGAIVIDPDGSTSICTGGINRLMFGQSDVPNCDGSGTTSVALVGLDATRLPEPKTSAGFTWDLWASVTGTWTGDAITVAAVAQPSAASNPFGAVNATADVGECPPPPAGWLEPADPADFRKALTPLAADIAAHQELYAGYETQGMLGIQDTSSLVEIVRARVDPATLRSRVDGLFPYAICITGLTPRQPESVLVIDDAAVQHFARSTTTYPLPFVRKVRTVTTAPSAAPASTPFEPAETATGNGFELPAEIDGRPVLVGDAAIAAFRASTDATPMLVGGWVAAPMPISCPMLQSPNPFWACSGVFIRARPYAGPTQMVLHPGSSDLSVPSVPAGDTVPVVYEVHTHDVACTAGRTDCLLLPVVDRLVWLGSIGPVPSPTSTQPPNGLTESAIRQLAVAAAQPRSSVPVVAVSFIQGHYAEVGPPGSMDVDGDRWVWAVIVDGHFSAPDCQPPNGCVESVEKTLIVLDYVTGEVLIQETPPPSS